MRTILLVLLLMILVVPAAHAQGPVVAGLAPSIQAGIGYSYTDADVPSLSKLGMNGLLLTADADFSRRFGVALDVGYARAFNAYDSNHSADMLTYMAGPIVYPLRKRNLTVYVQALFGGARETGVNFESNGQIIQGYANRFAWAGGAGAQYRLTRSFSVRVGADYLRTSFFNSNVVLQSQYSIRPSASLIYTFGEGRER